MYKPIKSYKIRYRILIFLSVLFTLSSESISAAENQPNLSPKETAIVEQIVSYLSLHSLSPFVVRGKAEYAHLSFIEDTHALGMIEQEEKSYLALFSIQKPWVWGEIKVELIYITTDSPISPILFADVAHLAAPLLQRDLSRFHVFIERKEDASLPRGSKLQKWTFFNQHETVGMFVTLTEDGQGGMYFSVHQ